MDISKAKNIMIFVFLGLNIFLVYQLIIPLWTGIGVSVAEEEIKGMEELLAENNYQLNTSVPKRIKSRAFVTVNPPEVDPGEIKRKFYEEEKPDESEVENKIVFETEEMLLEIYNNGYCRYILKDMPLLKAEQFREEKPEKEIMQIAEEFLQDHNIDLNDDVKEEVNKIHINEYHVNFYKKIRNIPIYSCFLRVIIQSGKVVEFSSYWKQVFFMDREQEMETIPATAAITRLVEELGPAPQKRTIEKIDLGFFSKEYEAEQWDVPPVWRIVLNNQEVYYINAFIGTIEAAEEQVLHE